MEDLFRFWGKASPASGADAATWHPLVYHALDVAAVAEALFDTNPQLGSRLVEATGLRMETVRAWLVWLAALHDLGKFALGFQGLCPERWRADGRPDAPPAYRARHDALARLLVEDDDEAFLDALGPIARGRRSGFAIMAPWLRASTSHHGRPATTPQESLKAHFPGDVMAAAARFSLESMELVDAAALDDVPPRTGPALARTSWLVAGLITVADWIGSNRLWFDYVPPDHTLTEYWQRLARPRAAIAVAASGMVPVCPRPGVSFTHLFPGFEPTHLQRIADTSPLPDGPSAFFVEEATGGGKTEAALMLAARLVAAGRATGAYIGLPTMATANALYLRVLGFCDRWFPAEQRPELVLAHGQRALALTMLGRRGNGYEPGYGPGEATASSDARRWMTDSTRRSLLAQVAVGTIDQALLGALAVKHQAVRVFGLARSVLIVDEVHACDEYMLTTLRTLLEAHAALGGSAILLSATLPLATRQSLADAFRRGLGQSGSAPMRSIAYPLVTSVSGSATQETPVESRATCVRRVRHARVESSDEAAMILESAAREGRCGIWIRNTVNDAMSAASRLRTLLGPEAVMLLHARFCLGDRLLLEEAATELFGSASTAGHRAGRVVVATQIAEQSLDLDFDLMVTDAAPIDRLIQRAGRLQRHTRDAKGDRSATEGRAEPVLHVVGPAPSADADGSWHGAALGSGRFVYTNPAQIWRTLRWLDAHGGFEFPRDARAMMEAVFGDEHAAPLPDGIQAAAEGALAEVLAHRSIALGRTIDVTRGYVPDLSQWGADDEHDPGTRLGEPTTTLRLARREGDTVEPLFAASGWIAWPLSEVRVRAALAAFEDDDEPALRARARDGMLDRGERSVLVLLVEGQNGRWRGSVLDGQRRRVRVYYSRSEGLTTTRE